MIPMQHYQGLSFHLAHWLCDALPDCEARWSDIVLECLTPVQIAQASRNRRMGLLGLDLASLLKVALGNWDEIAARVGAPPAIRSLLICVLIIRNELAHPAAGQVLPRHLIACYQHIATALMEYLRSDRTNVDQAA